VPTLTNLTSGAGSSATSFATASVAPTGNRLILVSVHAYISTGSVQPATPTVTGNGITYQLIQSQDVDTAGVDRATVFLFRGLAPSPSSGAITISFGAISQTRCAWSVDQSDSDIDLSGANGVGAIAQRNGVTTAGATSLSASYTPSMRSDSAGFSLWGHQVQEVKTPRTSWTELSDVTSVTLANMETQFFSGTDTAASASWTTSSRAGGICIEIKKVAPFIWVGAYGLQGGTSGVTLLTVAGAQVGDLQIIWTADKNSSVDPTDPSGGTGGTWLRLGSREVGTGADGVGTGKIRLTAWWRVLSGTDASTAVTLTGANRTLAGGAVYHLTGAGTWATPTITFGEDTDASTTAFSALMDDDLAAAVDEYLYSVGAFTDVVALNGRSLTIPGSTQTRYDQIDSAGGAVGNKIFVWTDQRVGMVGTQSGAATTGATSGVGTTGGAMQIRIGLVSTTPVSASRATTWRAMASIPVTRATTWAVKAAVASTRATTWRVAASIAGTRATTWKTAAQTGSTRATTWRVAARIIATRATLWDVLTGAVASRLTTWKTAARTTATRATTWRTAARATSTRATTWDVAAAPGQVVATRATTWEVAGSVTASRVASWDVLRSVTATRSSTWSVKASVERSRSTTWRVLSRPTGTRSAIWRVVGTVSAQRSTTWRVNSSAPDRDLTLTGSVASIRFVSVVEGNRFIGSIQPARFKGEVQWR
jgi:hypothetical protein